MTEIIIGGIFLMSVINDIVDAAKEIDPTAPVVEAAEAATATIADPSASNILADIELAIKLVKKIQTATVNMHPTAKNILMTMAKELL